MKPQPSSSPRRWIDWACIFVLLVLVLTVVLRLVLPPLMKAYSAYDRAKRQAQLDEVTAPEKTMMNELCERAGEKIYRTVENVEGIVLLKVRQRGPRVDAGQFDFVDPYGRDVTGESYVHYFLRATPVRSTERPGFPVVETIEEDGIYRYDGYLEDLDPDAPAPRKSNRFKSNKTSIDKPTFRYGVDFKDISTREQRNHWIAGSSLRVIDLATGELIAERIGYMVDWSQGSSLASRSPWIRAASNACPSFPSDPSKAIPAFVGQLGQTYRFVSKVLKPTEVDRKDPNADQ